MKKHFLPALALFTLLWLAFSPAEEPAVEWLTPMTHDFGEITHKETVRHDFRFRNSSGDSLYIDNVRPACGCTVANWSDAPIAPDSTGAIAIEYDARDPGYFLKKIKVYFSGQRRAEFLYLEGDVVSR